MIKIRIQREHFRELFYFLSCKIKYQHSIVYWAENENLDFPVMEILLSYSDFNLLEDWKMIKSDVHQDTQSELLNAKSINDNE